MASQSTPTTQADLCAGDPLEPALVAAGGLRDAARFDRTRRAVGIKPYGGGAWAVQAGLRA